jgi:histidyl-tRNA synthetase
VFEIPRGTRDFSPSEMFKRRHVEKILKTTFETFGYREVQTPTFETLELFTAKSGEAITDEIYAFQDKGGRDLALRPELTAPVMRFYVDKLQMEPKPLKLYYFGNCFRYDRPQKGRYREFLQAGCELIGTKTPEAIAELICLAYSLFKNVNVKNISIEIGNLKLLSIFLDSINLNKGQKENLTPLIDKEDFDEIKLLLDNYNISDEIIKNFISFLKLKDINELKNIFKDNIKANDEINRVEKIISFLSNEFQVPNFKINMGIVRGLDYYNGIVFEIEAPALGAEKQILGGGEYELLSVLKGRDTPTSGFALGFDRTILSMQNENIDFPKTYIDYFIIPINEDIASKAVEITSKLRINGYNVDMDIMNRGIGKSLKYAGSINTKYAVIVGPKEIEQNSVTLRDMQTGEQKLILIDELLKYEE